MRTTTPEAQIVLPPLNLQTVEIKVVGDSPLIMHKWSEKAKKEMLDKQMKKAKQGKEAKNPHQDYLDSLYTLPDGGYCFPAVAFKSAAVSACRNVDMKMTIARGAFHVIGEMVKIEGEPRMREDMVRVGMGTADLRYRGEFPEWSAVLTVRYNANMISVEQIANLFNVAGFAVGVGEWRPEKTGSYGMFHVADTVRLGLLWRGSARLDKAGQARLAQAR